MAHKADELSGRVKQLEKELEQSQIQIRYYKTVIKAAEQEMGIAIKNSCRGPVRYQAIQLLKVTYPHFHLKRVSGFFANAARILVNRAARPRLGSL